MRKQWIRVAMLITAFTFVAATGCTGGGNSNSSSDNGSGGEGTPLDKYEDYSANKKPGNNSFDYEGNYAAPELLMDGKGEDEAWKAADVLATFGHGDAAKVKAYRGQSALFFLFEVKDTILLTEGETNDDAVTRSDSIEFYLDTLADGGVKPQNDDYQINLGIHGKTRIMQGSGSGWGNWNGLIDYAVSLDGTLNDGIEATDTGYSVEVMIPYSQINIEKNDTIAVSFGQVDKTGLGNQSGQDWDWYGWTYNGKLAEPQTPDNYILLDKDNHLMTRDDEEKPAADIAGYVVDSKTEQPISGATISLEVLGETISYTTDAQGYFIFEDINSENSYIILVTKDGYLGNSVEYLRSELREANGGRVLKTISIKNEADIVTTTLKGKVKNIVKGAVSGATVKVDGTTIEGVTEADGSFTIANVPAEENVILTISKDGFGTSKAYFTSDELTVEGDSISEIGEININLPYGQTGGFGNKNANFADSDMNISRTLTGIEFNLVGTRLLSGKIELYLDTKDCGATRDVDATCWRFDLNDNGTVTGTHYTVGDLDSTNLLYRLDKNDSTGYSATLFVPYDYLGISPLEVFGISLGQWSTTATDWDGWGFAGQFVAPETPESYIRVSATNELYRQNNNTSMVNLSGNAGIGGVVVSVGDYNVTTGNNGSWSMKVPQSAEQMTITYSRQGYISQTSTIEEGYFESNYSYRETIILSQQFVSISGKMIDVDMKEALAGGVITIIGTELTATTDENGNYTISDIPTLTAAVIQFEKDGYASQEKTLTAVELASKNAHVIDADLVSNNRIQYITATGKITNVNGAVEGVKISVEGNSALTALTDAHGEFIIENFAGVDCKIIIEKAGYITKTITFSTDSLESSDTSFSFGEIDLWLEYNAFNGLIADKNDSFAAFKGYVTRSATGFEFKFVGLKAFTGHLELFVDTKTSADINARDTSDYLFNLNADGTIGIVNWGTGTKNEAKPIAMVLTVKDKETLPVITFTLPYAFFGQIDSAAGITSTEVIGISAGQWSTSANDGAGDWDGWDNFALLGANGSAFVQPEMPQDYVRIGAHNEMYAKADNVAVDLSSYSMRFATGENTDTAAGARPVDAADDFYAKVSSRDNTGITFDFLTTGDFDKENNENEMVLIYFDTGDTLAGGWADVNYLIKISSDGTVYGKAGAWWSATEADKIGTIVITRENGITTFSFKVTYEILGIAATDTFGVAMREASHNATDHHLYDPWYDCYFEGEKIDAAVSSGYARIDANGKMYKAENNG